MNEDIKLFSNVVNSINDIFNAGLFHNQVSEGIRTAFDSVMPKDDHGKSLIKYKSCPIAEFEQKLNYHLLRMKVNEYEMGLNIQLETQNYLKELYVNDKKRLASYLTLEKALIVMYQYYIFFLANGFISERVSPQVVYAYYNSLFKGELGLKDWKLHSQQKNAEHNPAIRNAKLFTYDVLLDVANYLNDDDIVDIYTKRVARQQYNGYENNKYGAVVNYLKQFDTESVLYYFNELNKKFPLSEGMNIMYGLPVSDETVELIRKRAF